MGQPLTGFALVDRSTRPSLWRERRSSNLGDRPTLEHYQKVQAAMEAQLDGAAMVDVIRDALGTSMQSVWLKTVPNSGVVHSGHFPVAGPPLPEAHGEPVP